MNEPIFGEGLFFSRPREGAPDFIKGSLSIQPEKLKAFLEKHKDKLSPKGYLNLDLKLARNGDGLYFQVNTWKPLQKPTSLSDEEVERLQKLRGEIPF